FWKDKLYLIIDEKSMLSRKFLVKISAYVAKGKSLADFHQFPPVAVKKSAALYYPCDSSKDTAEEMLGRKIYEQFTTVVCLKEQIRVTDPEWNDLLHHIRHSSCCSHHVQLLCSLVLTNPHCPPTDFNSPPWNDAVLITPCNAVRRQWNLNMTKNHCQRSGNRLFVCKAKDTIQGRELTLMKRYAVATKPSGRNAKQDERAALPNVIKLAVGVKVMVTFNVDTELNVANGA
ncbi:uncharacterized protein HD556DRAFT_1239539, partial [Suillus plorans]